MGPTQGPRQQRGTGGGRWGRLGLGLSSPTVYTLTPARCCRRLTRPRARACDLPDLHRAVCKSEAPTSRPRAPPGTGRDAERVPGDVCRVSEERGKSEPGAIHGPGQPQHVWSRVRGANTLGAGRPQTGSASVAGAGRGAAGSGWGWHPGEGWRGAAGDRARSRGRQRRSSPWSPPKPSL